MNLPTPYCDSMLVGEMWFLEDLSILYHLQTPNFQPWGREHLSMYFRAHKELGWGIQGEVTEMMH